MRRDLPRRARAVGAPDDDAAPAVAELRGLRRARALFGGAPRGRDGILHVRRVVHAPQARVAAQGDGAEVGAGGLWTVGILELLL